MGIIPKKVKEHFLRPKKYAGAVAEANAVGDVGSLSCGDGIASYLKKSNRLQTLFWMQGFKPLVVGSAIASFLCP